MRSNKANFNSNSVSILLGTGTGSFGAKTDFATGNFPRSVATGDFNGDGKFDLAATNLNDATVSILLNNTPPSITAALVTRAAGSPSANSQIATVDDAQDAAIALSVTVNGGTSATVNSVTVTLNPTAPNASGQVFADVVAGFAATTASFTIRVTDSCGLFTEATLTIIVNPGFNLCLQDDSNPNTVFLANSVTGAYRFCCGGTTFTGVAQVVKRGNIATFQDNSGGRRVEASIDGGVFKGTAVLQSPSGTTRCMITDRDTRNNRCVCQ